MCVRLISKTALVVLPAVFLGLVGPVAAQTAPAPVPGPAPAAGQAWATTTNSPAAPAGVTLDEKQVLALRSVSQFFNGLKQLKGVFAQTNPDGKKLRGKFALKQPGKFRFDYGFGSKMVIISDGTTLQIADKDIATDDRIELDKTPFRILLRKDVDLMRDARVFEIQEVDDLVIVSIGDKSPDAPGKIRLFLTKKPAMELKEWVTTDGQGTDTRTEVSELTRAEELDDALFKVTSAPINSTQQK
jgi:outer membrane lipoprotein-sorting protein